MTEALYFLISTLFKLFLMLVILRFWLQTVRADFYNPVSQFVVKATNPALIPLRRIIPSIGKLDTASLVLAFALSCAYVALVYLLTSGDVPLVMTLLTGLGTVVFQTLDLMFYLMLLMALLSWFSQGRSPVEYLMRQMTEPLLAPIRKVVPVMAGLDLSVMVFVIGVQFVKILLASVLPTAI